MSHQPLLFLLFLCIFFSQAIFLFHEEMDVENLPQFLKFLTEETPSILLDLEFWDIVFNFVILRTSLGHLYNLWQNSCQFAYLILMGLLLQISFSVANFIFVPL